MSKKVKVKNVKKKLKKVKKKLKTFLEDWTELRAKLCLLRQSWTKYQEQKREIK